MAFLVPCHYCGRQVDAQDPKTFRRVRGWQRIAGVRASGKQGGSDISLREAEDAWACRICIGRLKDGTAAAQESLL